MAARTAAVATIALALAAAAAGKGALAAPAAAKPAWNAWATKQVAAALKKKQPAAACARGDKGLSIGYEQHAHTRLAGPRAPTGNPRLKSFPRLTASPTLGNIRNGIATAAKTLQACADQCNKDFEKGKTATSRCMAFSFRPHKKAGETGCILGITRGLREAVDVDTIPGVSDYTHYIRNTRCTPAKKITTKFKPRTPPAMFKPHTFKKAQPRTTNKK